MYLQTWNNAQACKQCLCKFSVFGVKFSNVPAFYIENAQKGLCKAKYAKFACNCQTATQSSPTQPKHNPNSDMEYCFSFTQANFANFALHNPF